MPEWRLPVDTLVEMRAALDCLIAENPDRRGEHLVLRWGGGDGSRPTDTKFLDFARTGRVLDIIQQIQGPDLICWGAHVFAKPAGDGLEVPWHQDAPYWPILPLASVTLWLALDDATPENGCLRVIPGSHREKIIYSHKTDARVELAIDQVVDDPGFDVNSAADVVLAAGQMSIHDVHLLHGSNANRSPHRRAGLAVRYMPATSLYDRTISRTGGGAGVRQDMSKRPIYLVRGQDKCGNDFEIGQDRPFELGTT